MAEFDLVIKGGTVIDGLRMPRYQADIGIVGQRIQTIGRIPSSQGKQVLDAAGLIVAPGFVDLHTHYDSQIYWDPWCTISGYHGVTSVVIGNCGFGFAPCKPADRERTMLSLTRNEAVPLKTMQAGMPWDWETFPQYLHSLDATPKGVNVAAYIGLGPVYGYVMGGIDAAKERGATDEELELMCRIIVDAIEAGACGVSTQFGHPSQLDYDGTPMVTDTRSFEELAAFARAMGSTGRGFFQIGGGGHGDRVLRGSELWARESGRPVLYNVLSASAAGEDQHGQSTGRMELVFDFLDRVNAEGLRVYAQAVTNPNVDMHYTLEDYNLFDASAPWREATLGSVQERLARLSDPARRPALKEAFEAECPPGSRGTQGQTISHIPGLIVHAVPDEAPPEIQAYVGRQLFDIAADERKHVVDVFLDIACATGLRTEFEAQQPMSPKMIERMREIVTYKYSIPGVSDGGAHTKLVTLGSYTTRYLAEWVREHEMLDLEEAHWRLSTFPAQVAGITDRGFLREGAPADIVVYDFEKLDSGPPERAYDFPAGEWRLVKKATGYRYTIVNGKVTFEEGVPTGAVPGRVLRHGAALN
jgi:N-acyl-D-aspartate/D-glutamate deacylase